MNKKILIKKGVVVAVILLFVGVAFVPSVNANVIKSSLEDELYNVISSRHSVELTQQEAVDFVELLGSIDEKLASVYEREDIGIITSVNWIFFLLLTIIKFILDTIIHVIQLIKDGELLSEMFRGFCFILLVLVRILLDIKEIIWIFWGDFIPWEFEDGILWLIEDWLFHIVWPEWPYNRLDNKLSIVNNIKSASQPYDIGV